MENLDIFTCKRKSFCGSCEKYIARGQRYVEFSASPQGFVIRLHIDCAIRLGRKLTEINPLEVLVV